MTVYYKMRQMSLQNATAILLQKRERSLLQSALGFLYQNETVLLQNATVITKCDSYYKIRRLLQISTVHTFVLHDLC